MISRAPEVPTCIHTACSATHISSLECFPGLMGARLPSWALTAARAPWLEIESGVWERDGSQHINPATHFSARVSLLRTAQPQISGITYT